jgi:hypothetical protein
MHNQILVQVGETFEDLEKDELRLRFRELPALLDVRQEVATRAKLHNQAHVTVGEDRLKQLYIAFMLKPSKDLNLIENSFETQGFLLVAFKNLIELHRLDRNQFFGELVQCKMHFAEATLANYFANFV